MMLCVLLDVVCPKAFGQVTNAQPDQPYSFRLSQKQLPANLSRMYSSTCKGQVL